MPSVPNKARPEAQPPTRGQYVDIQQSVAESHLPSKKNYDDAAFVAALTAQTFPSADDRKHLTGDDAIAFGSNLITDTFVSWNINGDVTDEAGSYRFGASTPGVLADMSQGLGADPTEGQEIRITFDLDHDAGGLLQVAISDAAEVIVLDGAVGGRLPGGGASSYTLSRRIPRDTTGAKIIISDVTGTCNALISNIVVAVREQTV